MSIARLHLLVEGQTEEDFVNRILAPFLHHRNVIPDCRQVRTGRKGAQVFKGGFVRYAKVSIELGRWMKEDQSAYFSTMFDLYKLGGDFPEFQETRMLNDPLRRAERLEAAMAGGLGGGARLIPYIQVHEFEALLFADPAKFAAEFPGMPWPGGRDGGYLATGRVPRAHR